MSKKNRFVRQVLSGLNDAINSSLSEVEELTNSIANCKAVLVEVKEKTDKMIELIDADDFPADKKIQGDVFDLDSIVVPTISAETKNLLAETEKELHDACPQIVQCYEHVMSKVQPEQVKSAPTRTSTKPSSSKATDTTSGIRTFSPSPLMTPPEARNEAKVVVSCANTASSIRQAVMKMTVSPKKEESSAEHEATVEAMLESIAKIPEQEDTWNNFAEENDSLEDDIKPEDSASNVGSPIKVNAFRPADLANSEVQSLPPTPEASATRVVIPRRRLACGQEISNISCEWIVEQFHPYRFWLRVSHAEYDNLMTSLYHWKSNVRPLPEIKLKLYCLAKYHGEWYRAYVTRVLPHAAIVVFIDYGNMEQVGKNDMGVIPEEFTKLPWQAFLVALFGVKPESGNPHCLEAWSPQVLSFMKSWFSDSSSKIDCRVAEVLERLPAIVKIRKTQNATQMLLHEVLRKQQNVPPVNLGEQVDLLKRPAPNNPTEAGAKDLPRATPDSLKQQQNTPTQQHSDLGTTSPVSSDDSANTSFYKAFNETPHLDGDPIDFCPPLPDSKFGVKLTAFHDGDDLYVQLADKPAAVDQKLAAKRCSKNKLDTVRAGRYVLYFSPKRELYARGKVIGLANNGEEFDALDVDTGLIDRGMPFPGAVVALSAPFQKGNRAAIHCCLDMHSTNPKTQLRSDFENFFKLKLAGRVLSAAISPKATTDEITGYRTGEKPLPIEIHVDKTYLADLIYPSLDKPRFEDDPDAWRKWKFDGDYGTKDSDDDDGDDDVVCPANPELYLLGFQPRDDEVLCKHFRRTGQCPRGKYCSFKHEMRVPYLSTVEREEFGIVGTMHPEVGTRVYVRLPCDWQVHLPEALKNHPTAEYVPLWLQLPTGAKDWKDKEDELCKEIGYRYLTYFEEPYLEMEVEMTGSYNSKPFITPNNLIPTEHMHVAVCVSPRALGSDDDSSTTPLAWVRGAVIETLRNNYHANVQLLDYGSQVVATAEHIRPLDSAFADRLPSLAMLFYVIRSSAEKLWREFGSSENDEWGLCADVVDNDDQAFVPVIKLLSVRRKVGGLEITLLSSFSQ